MKRSFSIFLFAVVALGLTTGCMGVASPVAGWLYTDSVQWDGSGRNDIGTLEGRACAQSFFAIYARGDASVKTAAANGGISNVMSIDHESSWLLFFGEYCTIVRGT